MITIRCTCGETYHADEQHVGLSIRCNRCGKVLEVVAASRPQDLVGSQVRFDLPPTKPLDAPTEAYPRHTSKPATNRWMVAANLAVISLLSWVVYRIVNLPQERTLTPSIRPPAPPVLPSATIVQPLLPPCQPDGQIRPRSGAELGGRYRGGLGGLRVTNGTDLDAVAVLIDDATEGPRRAIFIRSGESGAMTSVPLGRYRLRFQVGSKWLTERRFCRTRGTSEFDDAFDFEEVESATGTRYSTYEVTLHPVPEGTARTHVVPDERFDLPPP